MKTKVFQYILIILILSGIAGGYFYYRSSAAQKINASKVNNLTSGLVGYWTMDGNNMSWSDATHGTVVDSSGIGNNGTLTYMSQSTSPAIGKIGQSLNFDGNNDYVNIGNPNLGITDISVCAWIYPKSLTGNQIIFQYINSSDSDNFGLRLNDAGAGILDMFDQNNTRIYSNTALAVNSWQYFCITMDASPSINDDYFKMYIGGSLNSSATANYEPSAGNSFTLGGNSVGGSVFNGSLDEVRVYNRVLTPSEITELYQQGQTKINASEVGKVTNGLVHHWTFDGADMTATTAIDRVGGNTGTLYDYDSSGNVPTKTIGKIGQALALDGTDGAIDIADITTSGTTATTYSVSMWIKPDSQSGSYDIGALMGASGNHAITFEGSSRRINYRYKPSGTGSAVSHFTASTLSLGDWHHVVVTVSNGTVAYYLDGTVSSANNPSDLAPPITIPSLGMSVDAAFWGSMDEFRYYNRVLSQSEITELYQQGQTKINASQTGKLTSGLVGYWTMDGQDVNWGDASTEIKDQSGNALHADATNMTAANAAIGKIGQGMNFNTANASVHKTDSGTTPLDLTGSMTFSAWIKLDSLTATMPMIAIKGSNFRFHLDDNGNCEDPPPNDDQYELYLFRPSGACSNNDVITQTNRWYHIAATFDTAANPDYTQFYVDGVPAGVEAGDATPVVNNNDFMIGNWERGGVGSNFPGSIDEVRIYNRALSASEIAELYNQGR